MNEYLALLIGEDERVVGQEWLPAADMPGALIKLHAMLPPAARGWELWLGGNLLAAEGAKHALKRQKRLGNQKYLRPFYGPR